MISISSLKSAVFVIATLVGLLLTPSVKAQGVSASRIVYLTDTAVNFNGLLDKFKGKIVYIDIWATWCSPCRKELQAKKDIKGFDEFALKNDVVLLYICCDKNGNAWKQFITANKLAGYHILANQAINNTFHTAFATVQNRQGKLKSSFYIPRHIIIDQTGAVADSSADRQGSAAVYSKINKLLDKSDL